MVNRVYCQGGQFQSVCFCPQRHFPTVVFLSSQKAYSSLDAEEGSVPELWWPRSPPQLASIETGEQTLRLPQSSLTHTGASLYRLSAVRVGRVPLPPVLSTFVPPTPLPYLLLGLPSTQNTHPISCFWVCFWENLKSNRRLIPVLGDIRVVWTSLGTWKIVPHLGHWHLVGPCGTPEHKSLPVSPISWLQQTSFIQPPWTSLSYSEQVQADVN